MPLPLGLAIAGMAASAGGNLVNTFVNRKTSKENTRDTIRAQKELAEYSYQQDREMWNAANLYNSPAQQMQRLKAAGLNPNLVYGNGSVVGNTSTQTPKYQQYDPQVRHAPIQLPDLGGILSQFQDLKIKSAQADNLAEDNRRKRIENMYLTENLSSKNRALWLKNLKDSGLYGQHSLSKDFTQSAFQDSPFMKQFQATTSQKVQDAQLKRLEGNLRKQGVSSSDNLLLRMLIQSGLFSPQQITNMFKK